MCKATCQNKCQPGARFKDCNQKAYGQAHGHTKDAVFAYDPAMPGSERTAQHAPAVKIPVGMRQSIELGASLSMGAQSVLKSRAQGLTRTMNAMQHACAIASELARESRDKDDPEPYAALMRAVSPDELSVAFLKLVARIGLRNWFDGDFVVLSAEEARKIAGQIDARGIGSSCIDLMNHKITEAARK